MACYRISSAKDAGFYVSSDVMPGMMGEMLFAGSLDDCLEYVRRTFNGPENPNPLADKVDVQVRQIKLEQAQGVRR